MDGLDYWRLCDELNVIQAAFLIIGRDPAGEQGNVEGWEANKRPEGYDAAKCALSSALLTGAIEGTVIPFYDDEYYGTHNDPIDGSINIKESRVRVTALRAWLADRGFRSGFFFPTEAGAPDYLDRNHPSYAPKLAAAVRAWEAVTSESKYRNNGKHVKQNLESWLTAHAAEFDLVKSDGEINADAIKNQIAKVANWKDKGGAPRTPGDD